MLKKLIDLLPVSRRKYAEGLMEVAKVIEGLVEAEANHCQIEMNMIQQLQKDKILKPKAPVPKPNEKSNHDVAFT